MICSACNKRIDPSKEDFEEVGPIEFMHTECVDKLLKRVDDVDDYKKEPESPDVS